MAARVRAHKHAVRFTSCCNRIGITRSIPRIIAWVYVGLGDKDQALAWLEKAYAQHSNELTTMKVCPVYDPLRSDPRFQDLLRRLGLAQ